MLDEPVTLQGWDGYALDIEDAQGALVQMRTYIVKDRLFRLLVTAKNNEASKAAAKRFLDSLRLAETRPSLSRRTADLEVRGPGLPTFPLPLTVPSIQSV